MDNKQIKDVIVFLFYFKNLNLKLTVTSLVY